MVMQFDPLDPSDSYKFEILKIREGGGRHFEKKIENSPYVSNDEHDIVSDVSFPTGGRNKAVLHIQS